MSVLRQKDIQTSTVAIMGIGLDWRLLQVKWLLERMKGDETVVDGRLRDIIETEGAPRKEAQAVLTYLFKVGALKEDE